ncbi:MAG: exopolysaccharide biosynthesis protein [Segetibacter sp.]|nr:exopolysaccharide biosynthesis protein [Segetibacter sp.]
MLKLINRRIAIGCVAIIVTAATGCNQDVFIPDSPIVSNKTYSSPLTKKVVDRVNLVQTVIADTLIELAPGVKQTTINYLDYSNKPMRIFIIEADLNNPSITLKAGTPNNRTTYGKQTVTDIARLQDSVKNRVIAAVNGDFFNATTGEPQSILFKNGVAVKPLFRMCDLCTSLTVDNTGNPVIITKPRVPQIDSTKIREAVGGYHLLVQDGLKVGQGDPSIEPRTAVGVTTGKIVYFVVVDGRKADYSNGFSLGQLSDVFVALGVKDAINLDGGGSTTLVVKEGANWIVKNRPSDPAPRPIGNAWTIVDVR